MGMITEPAELPANGKLPTTVEGCLCRLVVWVRMARRASVRMVVRYREKWAEDRGLSGVALSA